MTVIVGSRNPVKLEAVRMALSKLWPQQQWQIVAHSTASGVNEQPLSDREMIKGARARARAARHYNQTAGYAIGIEGGLYQVERNWFGRSWVAIVDQQGGRSLASSVSCPIPAKMMHLIHQGKNISEVCEILYGQKDIGKREGYVGLLTNNRITRASAYTDAVIMALSQWVTPAEQSRDG